MQILFVLLALEAARAGAIARTSNLVTSRCQALLTEIDTADFRGYLKIKDEIGFTDQYREMDNRNLAGTFYDRIPHKRNYPMLATVDDVRAALPRHFAIPKTHVDSLVLGRGVRAILLELLRKYAGQGYAAILPEDIYPVYEVEAREVGFERISTYRSIPRLEIPATSTSGPEVMVITSPLSPAGRALSPSEVTELRAWLDANPKRRLVLDTVYTFDIAWDRSTLALLEHPRVIAIHSFAKAWLVPGMLGFAVGPKEDLRDLPEVVDLKLASQAIDQAVTQPHLPIRLNENFAVLWHARKAALEAIDPEWRAPENGYLAPLPFSTSTLLREHGWWSMPLATFGSPQKDWSVVSALDDRFEDLYYVTTLSNLVRGYDKYANEFSKTGVPESRFSDRFFLLSPNELHVGLEKTRRLLEKTVPGDRVIVMKTGSRLSRLLPNERTGLGRYVARNHIWLEDLYYVGEDDRLERVRLEDAMADSFALNQRAFVPFDKIKPRSLSLLPIPLSCQARCKFCFSEASESYAVGSRDRLSPEAIESALVCAKEAGAERVVITGGGEPTLVGPKELSAMIAQSAKHFPGKITMITNGLQLARLGEEKRLERLLELDRAGLSVLAISRHHHDPAINREIMGIDTKTEDLVRTWASHRSLFKNIKLRFVCVLQKAGVKDEGEVESYVRWARALGVTEINFKELYVATDRESEYVNSEENLYSERNRVYLRTVLNYAKWSGWREIMRLPWGAPVFENEVDGQRMQIAAYTEPSLFWERTHGVARSWNLMADGKLLVSLETGESEINPSKAK